MWYRKCDHRSDSEKWNLVEFILTSVRYYKVNNFYIRCFIACFLSLSHKPLIKFIKRVTSFSSIKWGSNFYKFIMGSST